jgi:hypothetical protein
MAKTTADLRGCAGGDGDALEGLDENEMTETIVNMNIARIIKKRTTGLLVSNLLRLPRGFLLRP